MNYKKLAIYKSVQVSFASFILIVSTVVSSQTNVTQYKEMVGQAGNEYYDPRVSDSVSVNQLPQPVHEIFELIKQNLSRAEITSINKKIKPEGIRWRIDLQANEDDRWIIVIWSDGRIYEILSRINNIREEEENIFEAGNIRQIPIETVPFIVLEKIEPFRFGREITKSYSVDAVGGHRYFVQFGSDQEGFIFSLTDTGEIGSAAIAPDMLQPITPRRVETMEEIAARLSKYGKKYQVGKVINRIKKVPYNDKKGFRFVVMGDSRANYTMWETIVKSINKWDPLFAINTGDLTSSGYSDQFDDHLLSPLGKFASYPFLPVIGNHDRGGSNEGQQYEYVFGGDEARVYSFDYNSCRFIVLDNAVEKGIMSWQEQLDLADKWLSEQPDYKKLVFLHYPPHEVERWIYHSMSPEKSAPFVKLMSKHKVDHVFCGHIHAYSTATYDGVDYTVTGGGGAPLHFRYGELGSVYHYVIVDVGADSINMRVVRFYPQKGDE